MSNSNICALEYNGIRDLNNSMSRETSVIGFRFSDDTKPVKLAQVKVAKKDVVKPRSGITMLHNINVKKIGSLLMLALALGTIITSLSGSNAFSNIGAIIIVLSSLFVAFMFWSDDNERKKV
ncbi:hypothetical protein [Paenibacillus sp. Cedars]|uniref:hypothetical protein n=1 Tax=Paenibacillus sp. Cedars TaxID=1980674 RepID=UPI001161CF7D|nr:hypothetical protein [Paenibacillus sp. Cedars]AWP28693.1 hypothetical protein B9D94_19595 [Paenibacillus sp. Cedars]